MKIKFLQKSHLIVLTIFLLGSFSVGAQHASHTTSVTVAMHNNSPAGCGTIYASLEENPSDKTKTTATITCPGTGSDANAGYAYLFAEPNSGYRFVAWRTSATTNTNSSTNNPYSYQLTYDRSGNWFFGYSHKTNNKSVTLYAYFERLPEVTYTFNSTSNGTYKFSYTGHAAETVSTTNKTTKTRERITLTASPNSGYQPIWYYVSGGNRIFYSSELTTDISSTGDLTVGVEFVAADKAMFMITQTGLYYDNLNTAISACGNNTRTIALVTNGTLPSGTYNVTRRITLLIPDNDNFDVLTDVPRTASSYSTPSPHKTLTMANGAIINLDGSKLCVNASRVSPNSASVNPGVSGKYGMIYMNSGSQINVSYYSGNYPGAIYAWGYISGEGKVTVNENAQIYEMFVIADYRGYDVISGMNNNGNKVFPFSQWYVQNIEAEVQYNAGAVEYVSTSNVEDEKLMLVGANDQAMFRTNSSVINRKYDRSTDRIKYSISGNTTLRNLRSNGYNPLYLYDTSNSQYTGVQSANLVFPLNGNVDVEVKSGTLSLNQDLAMLPGSQIKIASGATMQVNSGYNLYVYDSEEWKSKNFVYPNSDIKQLPYVARNNSNVGGAPASRSVSADAKIIVNGTLQTASTTGAAYTTSSKADICSDGSGVYKLNAASGTATATYQATQSGSSVNYPSVAIEAAHLHNADGSYTATAGAAASTTVNYKNGHWGWKVQWKDADGTVLKTAYHYTTPNDAWVTANKPSDPTPPSCKTFNTWNQTENNTTNQERVYTASYNNITYTITYDKGTYGTGTNTTDTKICGSPLTLKNAIFTREGYTQKGWSTSATGTTKDFELGSNGGQYTTDAATTLYPYWGKNVCTLTWKDYDGTELKKVADIPYGDPIPTYDGKTPTRPSDATYAYVFNNTWTASPAVTDNKVSDNHIFTPNFDAVSDMGAWLDIIDWDGTKFTINMNDEETFNTWTKLVCESKEKAFSAGTDGTFILESPDKTADHEVAIRVMNASAIISLHHYKVPYAINSNTTLGAVNATSTVFVRNGATLTVNANKTLKAIYVAPEAKLIINSGVTLTVDTLVLRTEAFTSASLTNNGTISGRVFYSRIVKTNAASYQFGLPFTSDLTNCLLSNGKSARRGSDFALMTYNSEKRASSGVGAGNWTNKKINTLEAKTGYQLLSSKNYYREYYFPVTYSAPVNTIAISDFPSVNMGDAGWNYMVSPFTYVYNVPASANPEDALKICMMDYDNEAYYQVVPTQIMPALPFFYQAAASGVIEFGASFTTRSSISPSAPVKTQWLQIFYGATDSDVHDQTNIYLHPRKFSVEYELGYDVIKMSKSGKRPFVWSALDCGELAFAALPDSVAAQQRIPVSVFTPTAGEMTFMLNFNDNLDRIESLLLYDMETGSVTNLFYEDYNYFAEQGTQTGRFFLQPIFRKAGVATDIVNTDQYGSVVVTTDGLNIMLDNLSENVPVVCYDATGRLVARSQGRQTINISVPVAGIYMIQIGNQVNKVVIK